MGEIYKNLSLENIEGEEWRDVIGYNGLYQVSSSGRVKSLKFGKDKILRQGKNKYGYLYVKFYKDGKSKILQVHRLVAQAFIENPNNLPMINHKDEDKTNNIVDNLEWCNNYYNITYGTCQQKKSEKLINRQDQSKQVYQYNTQGELIKIWESTMECKRNGYTQSSISACCRGELKSHRGYIWSYEEL